MAKPSRPAGPDPMGAGRHLAAALLLTGAAHAADDGAWQPGRAVQGVALEFRPAASGYRAYRGKVRVCTDLETLRAFVAEVARFPEWIPYTEAARALPAPRPDALYYLRTSTPWPLQSRDMVYRLSPLPAAPDGGLRIAISGEPDALPPQEGAVRMRAADGQWTLHPHPKGIDVTLRMAVDPAGAPAFFANRRLGAAVAGTLANLEARFPCEDSHSGS